MSPAFIPSGAQASELLQGAEDLVAVSARRGHDGCWKHAAVLVFRSRRRAGLRLRVEQGDPGCVVADCSVGALALVKDAFALRRLAERSPDLRVGVGPVVPVSGIWDSLARAMDALAFTNYGSAVSRAISYSELGALTVLARLPREELAALPGMEVVASINESEIGRAELEAVEALCRTGTLRRAAEALHIHHSSVASRVRNVEGELGYRLAGPIQLGTAYAAVLGLRLLERKDARFNGWA